MATTARKETVNVTFRDNRDDVRGRTIEQPGTTQADVTTLVDRLQVISKSGTLRATHSIKYSNDAFAAEADSDVSDTVRLYFELEDTSTAHFDIPDPADEIFEASSGPGANIVKEKSVLDAAVAGTPEKELGLLIDAVLAGTILISDGETPAGYLHGERV